MFILYAMPIGAVAGWAMGGRLAGLSAIQLRWAPLAVIGLLAQVVLFAAPVAERIGWLGAPIYVVSTGLVLLVVVRNARIPGLALIALGAALNLAAIVTNGGQMPASAEALASLGKGIGEGYSNSAVAANPALWPLTDLFAMPSAVPFANVFSVGDLLIGVGVAVTMSVAMRGGGARGNLVPESLPR